MGILANMFDHLAGMVTSVELVRRGLNSCNVLRGEYHGGSTGYFMQFLTGERQVDVHNVPPLQQARKPHPRKRCI